jgi:hypothetical protein
MLQTALRKLKDGSWFVGPTKKGEGDPGSPYFSTCEIDSLRRQLRENSEMAAMAAIRAGVKLHPKIAALRASSSK